MLYLLSHKISEKYNEQVFYKKLPLNILQYSQENSCVGLSFLIKTQAFSSATLLKRESNTGVFLRILQNLKNTPVLRYIYEQLFERFPTWPNNVTSIIGSKEDIFSKTKQKKNILKLT